MQCSQVAPGKHVEGKREKGRPRETQRPCVHSMRGSLNSLKEGVPFGSFLDLPWGGVLCQELGWSPQANNIMILSCCFIVSFSSLRGLKLGPYAHSPVLKHWATGSALAFHKTQSRSWPQTCWVFAHFYKCNVDCYLLEPLQCSKTN